MKKVSLCALCILVFTAGSILARPNFVPSAKGGSQYHPTPPPVVQQPPVVFTKLAAESVYAALAKEGLADNPVWVKETVGNKFKFSRQLQFEYMDFKGYICEFNSEKALDEAQEETLDINDKGEPYTWSIIQDNIILVLDGKLSEKEFLKFQEVLKNLK